MSSRLRSACLFSDFGYYVPGRGGRTVLLLAGQDGTLRRHGQDGKLGVAGVIAGWVGWPVRLSEVACGSLGTHGDGLGSAAELNGRWGVGMGGRA